MTAAEIGGLTSTSWALPPTRDFLCSPVIQISPLNKNVSEQSINWRFQWIKSEVGGASTTISQKGFCLLEVQSPAEFWKAVRSWAAARKGSTKSSVGPREPVTPPLWSFHLGRYHPISYSRIIEPNHRFLHLLQWQSQNGTNLEIIAAKGGEVCECCAWALLTAEERREGWVDICALLRDVEIAGELVREFPTRLDDGALETHTVAAHPLRQERLQYSRYTHGFCRRKQNPVSSVRP